MPRMRAPGAPFRSWICAITRLRPRSARGSCLHLRVETGQRVTGIDEVAVVDEPLGQYPVVGGRDVDLLAPAADRAQRRAGRQPGALGDVGRADGAAYGRDDDPPVGQVVRFGATALGVDQLPRAVEVVGAGQ